MLDQLHPTILASLSTGNVYYNIYSTFKMVNTLIKLTAHASYQMISKLYV